MAKKKATRKSNTGFVMSREIFEIVKSNPELSAKEAIAALKEKFPDAQINENSAGVSFSNARRDLGLVKKSRKSTKGKKTTKVVAKPAKVGRSAENTGLEAVQAARDFVAQVGNTSAAKEALEKLEALQVKS